MDSLRWDDDSQILTNMSFNNYQQQTRASIWSINEQQQMDPGEDMIFSDTQASQLNPNLEKMQQETEIRFLPDQELFPSVQDFCEGGVSTGSLDSLDGLISATNSNADTSVEDDGISMIFSAADCRNLWSFGANGTNNTATATITTNNNGAAISTEASGNVACEARNREILCPAPVCTTNFRETVSQNSSDRSCDVRNKKSSPKINNDKAVSTKRASDGRLKAGQCQRKNPDFDCLPMKEGIRFQSISETNPPNPKKPRSEKHQPSSTNISFHQPSSSSPMSSSVEEPDPEAIAQMKEMIYRAAAFRPVNLGLEIVEKSKRKNVKISSDPQTVAARLRRERISDRIRVLQRLVPGGSKMDTASMLDEAANYLKFLRSQVKALENLGQHKLAHLSPTTNITFSSLPFNHLHGYISPMQTRFPLP